MKKILSTLCLAVLALTFAGFAAPAARAQTNPTISYVDIAYNGANTEHTIAVQIDYAPDSGGYHWEARRIDLYLPVDCNHGGGHTNTTRWWSKNLAYGSSTLSQSASWNAVIKRNAGGGFNDGGTATIPHDKTYLKVWFDLYLGGNFVRTQSFSPASSLPDTVLWPTATTAMHLDTNVTPNGVGNWYGNP